MAKCHALKSILTFINTLEVKDAEEKRKALHQRFEHYNLFYMAQKYGKPCDMFELRKEEQDERSL